MIGIGLLVTGDEDGIGQPAAVKGMGERIPGSASSAALPRIG
jgi:hypothetical protein